MFLRQITDSALAQNAYLIGCQRSGEAIVIDPERDIDRYLELAAENSFRIVAVAETHIHADYLSGARELVERHGAIAYLSAEGGPDWQFEWAKGNPNARFLHDGDTFRVGNIELKALLTAGHTPEHLSFLVTDIGGGADEPIALLSGDFLFVGDVGRPDLLESAAGQAGVMEPSARQLYQSLQATRALSDHLQILPAHGAGSACGKALGAVPTSVLGYERRFNPALHQALNGPEDPFVAEILAGQPEPPLYFARMKRDNRLGPELLPEGRLPTPTEFSASSVESWLHQPLHHAIDLRSDRSAFAAGHLKGAIFAPLAGGKLPLSAGSYLTPEHHLLLVVENEAQVEPAVRQLIRIGLDRIDGWILAENSHGITTTIQSRTSDLGHLLELHPNAVVLDVRGSSEFATSHVNGAKNIAYTRLAARLGELDRSKLQLVHCGSGLRASMAVSFLESQGFDTILVNGDFSAIPHELLAPRS